MKGMRDYMYTNGVDKQCISRKHLHKTCRLSTDLKKLNSKRGLPSIFFSESRRIWTSWIFSQNMAKVNLQMFPRKNCLRTGGWICSFLFTRRLPWLPSIVTGAPRCVTDAHSASQRIAATSAQCRYTAHTPWPGRPAQGSRALRDSGSIGVIDL